METYRARVLGGGSRVEAKPSFLLALAVQGPSLRRPRQGCNEQHKFTSAFQKVHRLSEASLILPLVFPANKERPAAEDQTSSGEPAGSRETL